MPHVKERFLKVIQKVVPESGRFCMGNFGLARIAHSMRQPSILLVVFAVEMQEQVVWHAMRDPKQVNRRMSRLSRA